MILQQTIRHVHVRELVRGSVLKSHTFRPISIDINPFNDKKQQKKTRTKNRGRPSYRFVDRIRVRAAGGSGGNGSLSMFRVGRKHKRRPDGGHGGCGGSVLILADPKEQSLQWTRPHVSAAAGTHGSSQKKHGRNGKNLILRVPCGVVVHRILDHDEEWDYERGIARKSFRSEDLQIDANRDNFWSEDAEILYHDDMQLDERFEVDTEDDDVSEEGGHGDVEEDDYDFPFEEREKVTIADLDQPGSYVVVARGGRGGVGSSIYASRNGPLPSTEIMSRKSKPQEGETAALELELKMIADIGLVGFPNAGKSSLLAAMSRATPHIAPYPFTTLHPLVGYIEYGDGLRICAADVPGLIAGASAGRGKGHDFLRHLERTKALLFIVDGAGVDGRDPVDDLQVLTDELSAYGNGEMMKRKSLVVANKMDLIDSSRREHIMAGLASVAERAGIRMQSSVLGISARVTGEGLPSLAKSIRDTVTSSEADRTREST